MYGEYKIRVKNSRNSYLFSLRRNLTILRGESGRGKTTLFDMIHEHNRFGKESGVSISCDRELIAIEGDRWKEDIAKNPGKIIVIDEDSHFIRSKEFAETVRGSDNYFLLITRNYLEQLPISVDEIYELSGAKNKKFTAVYREIDRMYDDPPRRYLPFRPQIIITEDSGSGYQFFKKIADRLGILCVPAGGKSQIFSVMGQYPDKNVAIIADGAVFGSEISDIAAQQSLRPRKVAIYLPESFEWLILSSGVVEGIDPLKLNEPWRYADSKAFMSWEQFFTDLLEDITKDSNFQKYSKGRLPGFYNQERIEKEILSFVKGIKLG